MSSSLQRGSHPDMSLGGQLDALTLDAVWPEKNRQMSIKLPKNDFTKKMIDFDTFIKIA